MMSSIKKPPPVSDFDASELDVLVARFAQEERVQYGVQLETGASGQTVLRAILREIEETMLPRRISMIFRPGHVISLVVSNRRLLTIETKEQDQSPSQETPEEIARHFAFLLRTSIEGASTVEFSNPERLDAFEGEGLSVSADLLRDALGLDGEEPSPGRGAHDLADSVRDVASSWIEASRDCRFGREDGLSEEIIALKEFWKGYAGEGISGRNRIQPRSRQLYQIPLGDAKLLVLMSKDEDNWVLALMSETHFESLRETFATTERRV